MNSKNRNEINTIEDLQRKVLNKKGWGDANYTSAKHSLKDAIHDLRVAKNMLSNKEGYRRGFLIQQIQHLEQVARAL